MARAVNAPDPRGSGPRGHETVWQAAPSRSSVSAPSGLRAAFLSPSARGSVVAPRWPAARDSDARPERGKTAPRRGRRVTHGSVGIASGNLLRLHHNACILPEQPKIPSARGRRLVSFGRLGVLERAAFSGRPVTGVRKRSLVDEGDHRLAVDLRAGL